MFVERLSISGGTNRYGGVRENLGGILIKHSFSSVYLSLCQKQRAISWSFFSGANILLTLFYEDY